MSRRGFSGMSARPANRGAHRLAWWIAGHSASRVATMKLRQRAGVCGATLARMIEGEVVPEPVVAIAIAKATDGQVLPEDWDARADRDWSEAP